MPIYSRFQNLSRLLSLTVLVGACLAPNVGRPQATSENEPLSPQATELQATELQATELQATELQATELQATGPAPSQGLPADTAEYEASEQALREHLKAMRILQVEFHMTETPARDREFREKWADMCDKGRPIFERARIAMLKKYVADPVANQALGTLLYELLDLNVTSSRFEGMLDVALALEVGGVKEPKLAPMIAMCALAENRYDLAKIRLETMPMESRPKLPILGVFFPVIDELQKHWEDEQRLRQQDALGEPLPQVKIRTTKGSYIVELFEDQAPETVANFIHLAEQGFFNGLTFHRVLEHFVAQTGCPEGDGNGGPGYVIYGEASKPNARKFFRGTLGVALSNGDENSGGSQFFICFLPINNLNGKYTAFGRIISGIEMIGSLTKVNPDDEKKKEDAPQILDEVIDITVIKKRNHTYEPNKVKS